MQYKFFLAEPISTKSTLDVIKERVNKGHLNQHYCKSLAHGLINYLCGKQERFERKPAQLLGTSFIQHTVQETLLNTSIDNNLFLLQIGKDYHTFVIERLHKGDSLKFIIYQSWYSTFTLDWWLGNDHAAHKTTEEHHLLREQYGKGNELTVEEMKKFILILTQPKDMPFSTKIGIVGAYKSYELSEVRNTHNPEMFI